MRKGLIVAEYSKREFEESEKLLPDYEPIHSLGKVYETMSEVKGSSSPGGKIEKADKRKE